MIFQHYLKMTLTPFTMESLGGFRDGSVTLTSTWTSERISLVADRLPRTNFYRVNIERIEQK